jgi:hypothetical protein
MAIKQTIWILLGILLISAWVLGAAIQSEAETMKCRAATTATKDERISVSDEEGHALGMQIHQGLAFFENGEIAKLRGHAIFDFTPGKGSQAITYKIFTFEDGSTIVTRDQRLMVTDQSGNVSAKLTGEIIKGTGRFEGIKGSISSTGKNFLPSKEEAARASNDITFTYTLPTK